MRIKLLIIFFVIGLCRLSAVDKTIEDPSFGVASHSNAIIDKITLSDTATIVQLSVFNKKNEDIQIPPDIYIQVNDKKYTELTDSSKAKRNEEKFSGKNVFTFMFPPIDSITQQLDFIGGTCNSCYKVWNIQLNPENNTNFPKIPDKIKNEAIAKEDNLPLETPELKAGNAILKGQFLGYMPEMNWTINIQVNNPVTGIVEGYEILINDDGSFEEEIPLISITQVYCRFPSYSKYFILSPGEESGLYVDLHLKSCQETQKEIQKCPKEKYIYFSGANANINNQIESINLPDFLRRSFDTSKDLKTIADMNAAQYQSYILGKMATATEALSQKGLTQKAFEFASLNVLFYVSTMLMSAKSTMGSAYLKIYKVRREESSKAPNLVFDKRYYSFLNVLPINNLRSLYSIDFGTIVKACTKMDKSPENYLANILGSSDGILNDMLRAQLYCAKMDEYIPLTNKELEKFSKLKDSFYFDYASQKNKELIATIEANKENKAYTIHSTPQVKDFFLLREIVSPFKGKVVLIDFWATWCVPCRNAMRQFEQSKNLFKGKDVVFLYLTDESSPLDTWKSMLPNIPGEHYRLSREQSKYIKEKLGARGIPAYLLLNKKGEQVFFQVSFPGSNVMSRLIEKELED